MLHHPRDLASILCRRVASPVTTSLPDSIGVYGCLLTWIYIQCVNSRSKSMPNVVAERIKQRRLLSSKNLFKCIRLKNNADVFWYPKCQRKHYDNHFICIFWKPHSLPARSMAPCTFFSWHGSWNQVWNSETIGVWTSFRLQSCSISLLSWWYKPTGCPKFKTVIQLHLLNHLAVLCCQKCCLHAPYLPRIESISQKKPCHEAFFDPKPEIQIFLGNNSGMNFQQLEPSFWLDHNLVTKIMALLVLSMRFPLLMMYFLERDTESCMLLYAIKLTRRGVTTSHT